jgi:uncharacterized protein (TIGR03083 family)
MMRAERRAIRDLLTRLTPEQWEAPTLCGDWTVRELVTHLVGWDDLIVYRSRSEHAGALLTFARLYTASLASMNRLNRRIQRRTGNICVEALIQRFAQDDDEGLKWLFDGTNPRAHLAEYLIHAEDIRRPLGLAAQADSKHLVASLHGVTQLPGVRLGAWRTLARRRVQASDLPWASGRGPVISMPGIDALMYLAGR